uniref:Resistance to inhibitors of cholinesterase protein 3 N-terminal domain-containing protein n=1 Tax=Esox lucius TaxID=8010 RepID=A0AAY5KUJ9_ESOLU
MSMSTFQKVTLVSCLLLCVALLLPKMLLGGGKKGAQNEGPGRFPPMLHRQMAPDSKGQRTAGSPRAHNTEAIARAKGGGGTGVGIGGKSNLAGQIIPIYGFGILLYILYILFKITSKGKSPIPAEPRPTSMRAENRKRKITDFELTQLQAKLRETEMVMERIVSKASHSPERVTGVSADQEERLLLQLREITRVMQEGRLVEGVAPPEMGAQNWEDFPEDSSPCWDDPFFGYGQAQATSTEERSERTDECTSYKEEGGAYQEESGAYQEESGCDQEESGCDQEESGFDQEESGYDQEDVDRKIGFNQKESVAYKGCIDQKECWVNQEKGVVDQEGWIDQEVGMVDQEEGMVDQEEGWIDQEVGMVDQEEGVVNQEEGWIDLEESVVDQEGWIDQEVGMVDQEECWIDQEEGVVDQQGWIDQEVGMVDEEEGVVNQEEGVVDQEEGVVDQNKGWIDQEEGIVDQKEGWVGKKEEMVDQKEGWVYREDGMVDMAMDDAGSAEAGADFNTDKEECAGFATRNEENGYKCDVGGSDKGTYREEGGAKETMGVADNEMGCSEEQGEELEFTLNISSVLEHEEKDSISLSGKMSTGRSRVRRRRNKKQKK